MSKLDPRAEATVIVKAKIGFYIHLAVYVLVNALLVTLDVSISPEHLWFQWPLLGWGLGLGLHAFLAFWLVPRSGAIKERMIQREMRKRARK